MDSRSSAPWHSARGWHSARRRLLPALVVALSATVGAEDVRAQAADHGAQPLDGQRVALVTGSTSGLGREVAYALAERGDHVIVHGRNAERGMEVVDSINAMGRGTARFYAADFASFDQVRHLAERILADYDRLDVLVNNAGIALIRDPQSRYTSEDGHELHWQVNYLSPFLLTELLLPLVRESAPARIVNVSSIASSPLDFDDLDLEVGYDTGRAYGQSKLAQAMHARVLAERLQGTGVLVNSLHPATFMDTNMITSAGLEPRSSVLEGLRNVLQLIDGEVGSGDFYVDGRPDTRSHPQVRDAEARDRLMRVSFELTGLERR